MMYSLVFFFYSSSVAVVLCVLLLLHSCLQKIWHHKANEPKSAIWLFVHICILLMRHISSRWARCCCYESRAIVHFLFEILFTVSRCVRLSLTQSFIRFSFFSFSLRCLAPSQHGCNYYFDIIGAFSYLSLSLSLIVSVVMSITRLLIFLPLVPSRVHPYEKTITQ